MNRIDIDLGIVALVIALAALIYAVLATRKRALLSHIAAVEVAMTREVAALRVKQDAVESRLARLPTGEEFVNLTVGLAELRGKQEAVWNEAHGARQAARRVEDFLLKAARHDPNSQY